MILIENEQVFGFESAIRGMRNPMNSWDKMDSEIINNKFVYGKNDLDLSKRLIKAGNEHCKFMRMIQVWFDLTLPRYQWSEFDTYKFNVKNSCSTMHKLFNKQKKININDFEIRKEDDELQLVEKTIILNIILDLNKLRKLFFNEKNQNIKNEILTTAKQILPESFLQKRTINTNYFELYNIYKQRKNHRLKNWHILCNWIINLPYFKDLLNEEY